MLFGVCDFGTPFTIELGDFGDIPILCDCDFGNVRVTGVCGLGDIGVFEDCDFEDVCIGAEVLEDFNFWSRTRFLLDWEALLCLCLS